MSVSTCLKEEYGGEQRRLNAYPRRGIGGQKKEGGADKEQRGNVGPLGPLNAFCIQLKEDDAVGKVHKKVISF